MQQEVARNELSHLKIISLKNDRPAGSWLGATPISQGRTRPLQTDPPEAPRAAAPPAAGASGHFHRTRCPLVARRR